MGNRNPACGSSMTAWAIWQSYITNVFSCRVSTAFSIRRNAAISITPLRQGDAAYNDTHLYLAESNVQTRREWIAALDTIESLKPRAVIAGHKKPEKDDNPGIIKETRQYIRDFERLAQMTTTARELYDRMLELYPNRANPGALWGSAQAAKH